LIDIPTDIADTEPLHRRIHPNFVKPDGSISSQAFRDPELSVDRGRYWNIEKTLHGYQGHGIAALITAFARQHGQEVVAAPELLNPAHALVKGHKTKALAREFARSAKWVTAVPITPTR